MFMAESFLKEQLERIQKLTERMSAVQSHAAELSDAMAHDRAAMRQTPLHEVRDYRTYSGSEMYHQPTETRRPVARESARRRRRR
jgi:hypothetical protein